MYAFHCNKLRVDAICCVMTPLAIDWSQLRAAQRLPYPLSTTVFRSFAFLLVPMIVACGSPVLPKTQAPNRKMGRAASLVPLSQ